MSEPVLPPALSEATRATIDTPALVVDLDRMDAAIVRMADAMSLSALMRRRTRASRSGVDRWVRAPPG
jgi:D-serine deaminase-like pyridoxal phosphate-dependent protein